MVDYNKFIEVNNSLKDNVFIQQLRVDEVLGNNVRLSNNNVVTISSLVDAVIKGQGQITNPSVLKRKIDSLYEKELKAIEKQRQVEELNAYKNALSSGDLPLDKFESNLSGLDLLEALYSRLNKLLFKKDDGTEISRIIEIMNKITLSELSNVKEVRSANDCYKTLESTFRFAKECSDILSKTFNQDSKYDISNVLFYMVSIKCTEKEARRLSKLLRNLIIAVYSDFPIADANYDASTKILTFDFTQFYTIHNRLGYPLDNLLKLLSVVTSKCNDVHYLEENTKIGDFEDYHVYVYPFKGCVHIHDAYSDSFIKSVTFEQFKNICKNGKV